MLVRPADVQSRRDGPCWDVQLHPASCPERVDSRLILAVVLTVLGASVATATEFPAGRQGYHSYTELTTEVAAVAAAHPDIVERFSIGTSYQGRQLWAVKISDNVTVDENEPEVMFDGTHHADEHMATEMTLHILHWLVDGYGVDPRITGIVNSREIWIVFLVNPDGAEYDISGGTFHHWRKNRQPTPGSTSIGTDLNRNYSYRWGGGGTHTSANPSAIHVSRPEGVLDARGPRDARLHGQPGGQRPSADPGRDHVPRIRPAGPVAVRLHQDGRPVRHDDPGPRRARDHRQAHGCHQRLQGRAGQRPVRRAPGRRATTSTASYRIFSYTIELSAVDYPDDSLIASETGRNKEAVLYLMERAWCPLSVLGAAVTKARCGAFDDDLEVYRGWGLNPDGTDTAPANARFVRANPSDTASHGPKQLGTTPSGSKAFVTGAAAGSSSTANDLDGRTTLRSPAITLAGRRPASG